MWANNNWRHCKRIISRCASRAAAHGVAREAAVAAGDGQQELRERERVGGAAGREVQRERPPRPASCTAVRPPRHRHQRLQRVHRAVLRSIVQRRSAVL